MNQNKTIETDANVAEFLDKVKEDSKKADCKALLQILEKISGYPAKMWGPTIVGFGSYHYKYASGREGDAPRVAFSPRASSIALYLSAEFKDREKLLEIFGKCKPEKGCIHFKKLSDVKEDILEKMVKNHLNYIEKQYP